MSSSFFLTQLISAVLLPPLNLLLTALAGLFVARSHPRLGRALLLGSFALLWLCSTPFFAGNALRLLEHSVKAIDMQTQPADAIIVLGGGTYFHAPEYGSDTVNDATLVRMRYAAKIQRDTGKPLLVTGGKPQGNDLSEAQQMKSVLEQEFKVAVRWTEDASDNTLQNARYSYQMLQEAGIKRVYLVTHAWHMPRSVMVFESAGFEVIPAPTGFTTYYRITLLNFLPGADALGRSWVFIHELIGLLWFRLRA
ncbi:MAG: YdcF family protein [Betaproteobacteria bacterium]|nr:MAG: YdcF family protein [Betaproteobacteria bacterium]